jgi:hypothetical protein
MRTLSVDWRLVLVAVATFGVPGTVHAQNLDAVISSFYPSVSRAVASKSIAAYEGTFKSHLAPGFSYMEWTGVKSDFAIMVRQVRADLAVFNTVTLASDQVIRYKSFGNHALVLVGHKVQGFSVDKAGKRHTLEIDGRSEDMWRELNGSWRIWSTKWISHLYVKDGNVPRGRQKPVPAGHSGFES